MVSLPLTGFPNKASDPVWVYVTGWVLYLSTWVIVISAAIQQVSSQVDYNLSQVCCVLFRIPYHQQLRNIKKVRLRVWGWMSVLPSPLSTDTSTSLSHQKSDNFLVECHSLLVISLMQTATITLQTESYTHWISLLETQSYTVQPQYNGNL